MLILASASPRRRELLTRCGVSFRVRVVPTEELQKGASPFVLLAENAAAKADAAAVDYPQDTVIGADTGIVFENQLIGKPADLEDAKRILRMLSGHTHEVCTAVALRGAVKDDFSVSTKVTFKELSDETIQAYLDAVPVLDKAGAYALQDHGDMIIASVEGDPDNVVGLPCKELLKHLQQEHVCLSLFWEFAKITTMVVGGGYVILAALEAEFVRRRKWLSGTEFLDLTATAQTVPGLIACNAAIYLGYTMRGWRGAFSALAGAALPPSVVIMLLASGVAQLPQDAPWVQGVFTGVSGCVAGLIAATAWRMAKKVLKGLFPLLVALAACLAIVLFRWNSGWLMLGAIPCGIAYTAWQMRHQRKNGGNK